MVKVTPHPGGELSILYCTKRAQYAPELSNHVTDTCRGLIVDGERKVVARPFEKDIAPILFAVISGKTMRRSSGR